jgi:hypothetical protein
MINKYNIEFKTETLKTDIKRLINQMWKLIPMRENDEDWISQLNVVIEEISGLHEIFDELDLLILLSKLEGLKSSVCEDFMIYRKTVFRCIDLLAKERDHIE